MSINKDKELNTTQQLSTQATTQAGTELEDREYVAPSEMITEVTVDDTTSSMPITDTSLSSHIVTIEQFYTPSERTTDNVSTSKSDINNGGKA